MDEKVTAAATTVAGSATAPGDPVRLVTIPAAAQLLGVSRSKLYELLVRLWLGRECRLLMPVGPVRRLASGRGPGGTVAA
jgi:hypothetical protein